MLISFPNKYVERLNPLESDFVMKTTQIILIDDLDGTEADATVSFSFRGVNYEIDLSDEHIAQFEKDLEGWIAKARRVSGRAARGSGRPVRQGETSKIRAWAKKHDLKVSDRGRIPAEIIEDYRKAHS